MAVLFFSALCIVYNDEIICKLFYDKLSTDFQQYAAILALTHLCCILTRRADAYRV